MTFKMYRNGLRLSKIRMVKVKEFDSCTTRTRLFSNMKTDERLSCYSFWKERYKGKHNSNTFDWFVDSKVLFDLIYSHLQDIYYLANLKCQLQYLELGCGMSELPQSVFRHSPFPVNVFAMDYIFDAASHQSRCVRNITPNNKESNFQVLCADVMKLPFRSDSIDIAVDKGTMDALLKDRLHGHRNSSHMMANVIESLKSGGRFLQISDEDPDSRLEFLDTLLKRNEGQNDMNSGNVSLLCTNESHVKKSMCTSWKFKVISSDNLNMEYFIYWSEKL